jgi:hypothetical protein
MPNIDTPRDIATLQASINELARAYGVKPDGFFSFSSLAGAFLVFVHTNALEKEFHDFVENQCSRNADLALEVAEESKVSIAV